MLDDLGHERVAVLDGGFPAWVAGGHPVTREVPTFPPALSGLADHWTGVDQAGVVAAQAPGSPRPRRTAVSGETVDDPFPAHRPPPCPDRQQPGPDSWLLMQRVLRNGSAPGCRRRRDQFTSCGSGVSACSTNSHCIADWTHPLVGSSAAGAERGCVASARAGDPRTASRA
jgi:thiosulfate/3-mercaptopyruvate sulfurtransferase